MPDQQISESSQCIPVGHMIAGIHSAKFRCCPAVYCLCYCSFIMIGYTDFATYTDAASVPNHRAFFRALLII